MTTSPEKVGDIETIFAESGNMSLRVAGNLGATH